MFDFFNIKKKIIQNRTTFKLYFSSFKKYFEHIFLIFKFLSLRKINNSYNLNEN